MQGVDWIYNIQCCIVLYCIVPGIALPSQLHEYNIAIASDIKLIHGDGSHTHSLFVFYYGILFIVHASTGGTRVVLEYE